MGGVGEGLAGREILKLSLQGAARSCFFQDSQKKSLLFALPAVCVGKCKGGFCPRLPVYVGE